jgi:TatD DNase family protein
MAGIHPCYVKESFDEELDFLRQQLAARRFAAIGEIGLDYYWDRTHDAEQMTCFIEQIALAKQYKLPIVIHSRNSMKETIDVLRQQKDELLRGIFHCFSGSFENAMDVIDCGLMLGIGGVVTYKNAGLAEVVAQLPLESIVLETDAPYLTPVPFRGKRNESSYLKYVVEKIADAKGVPVEDVARITTANARKVFGD